MKENYKDMRLDSSEPRPPFDMIIQKAMMDFQAKKEKEASNRSLRTEDEYESIVTKFEKLLTIEEKINYIYRTSGVDFLFSEWKGEINGKAYKYGLNPRVEGANEIGQFVYNLELETKYPIEKERVLRKLERLENDEAKKRLIQAEVGYIKEMVNYFRSQLEYGGYPKDWIEGYTTAGLGELPWFFHNVTEMSVHMTVSGAIAYLMEKEFLPGLLEELMSDDSLSESPIQNVHTLKTPGIKLVYLWATGIYDHLCKTIVKKNGEPHKTNIAKIIAHFTGEDAVRIKDLLTFMDYPKNARKDNPFNEENIIKVMNALHDDIKYSGEYLERLIKLRQEKYPDPNE